MIPVKHGQSPISTIFKYRPEPPSGITMDLSDFRDIDSHLKMVKNTIIFAIILSSGKGKLEKIHIQAENSKQELLKQKFLPLIHNQTRFFDIAVSPSPIDDQPFILDNRWVQQIQENINFPIEPVKEKLSEACRLFASDLLFYRTVSKSPLQIRYKGYQVGRWLSREGEIKPVNNKGKTDATEWISWLAQRRSDPSCKEYYDAKKEHYLESTLLKQLLRGHIKIGNRTITKLFPKSEVFFQFPVLVKPGAATNDGRNSAKFIDILAKSENRPVVMELKVWEKPPQSKEATQGKKAVNSRGEYMFGAFSQVLGYCNYLVEIFGNKAKRQVFELQELNKLDWDNPLIYVIINEIGDDEVAKKFRSYIREIKQYIINAEVHFVEFKQEPWSLQRKFEVKRII